MPKSQESSNKQLSVGELFAGVGGFRLGLERAGLKVTFSNQYEPGNKTQHASSCYVKRFGPEGHTNILIQDYLDLVENGIVKLPKIDVLVGGFPCQDYSVAKSLSSSKGLLGKKGVLWWEIHRLLSLSKAKLPKYIFLENVDRLLKSPSSQRGRDFAIMLKTLGDFGYLVEWRVVNAALQGLPQRRIRVFIVAKKVSSKTTLNTKSAREMLQSQSILARAFPGSEIDQLTEVLLEGTPEELTADFPSHKKSPFLYSGVYFRGVAYTTNFTPITASKKLVLGDVLQKLKDVHESYHIEDEELPKWEYLKGAKSIERHNKETGFSFHYSEGKMAWPDDISNPARTIVTGEGGKTPSRFKHVIRQDGVHRRLTPIELERLSGFPDNWTELDADGNEISPVKRAFFMGNALVVDLVEKVGRVIVEDHSEG